METCYAASDDDQRITRTPIGDTAVCCCCAPRPYFPGALCLGKSIPEGDSRTGELVSTSGSISDGGLLFENFAVGSQIGIDPDDVLVTPVADGSSIGLAFQPVSASFSVSGANGFGFLLFQYDVQSLSSGLGMAGSGLQMKGGADGNGYATSEADVYPFPQQGANDPLALNGAYLSAAFGNQPSSSAQFSSQLSIEVDSSFQLVSPDDSSDASITGVTETFLASSVPEPNTLVLLGMAFGIVLLIRRRFP